MKAKTWGVTAIVGIVVSVALGLFYQHQGNVVFSAGEDVSPIDLGLKNGIGFGAVGTILATIIAAWKSGSPAKIIQTICLVGLWATSFSNSQASAKINELAQILSSDSTPEPPVPEGIKNIGDKIVDVLKNLVKAEQKA